MRVQFRKENRRNSRLEMGLDKKRDMEVEAIEVVRTLRDAGYISYFAGGCVRDLLLNREVSDYDIATSATPEEVMNLFPRRIEVGAHFGVICVLVEDKSYDVATFRSDGVYSDGRRPESVTFVTPEEDASRRDFTINGIFLDPVEDRLIDFVGGEKDMELGVIRAIGNAEERFHEDRLRMLRAIRFATTLGFEIEQQTWDALVKNVEGIHKVSVERIREELTKILLHPNRLRGFDLLNQSGFVKELLPELEACKGCEQPPQFHPEGDVFVHTRIMLEMLPAKVSLELVLAVLLHDIGKPPTYFYDKEADRIRFNGHDQVGAVMAEKLLRQFRFPNHVVEDVVEMVANHMVFKDIQKMRVAKLKRFLARPTIEDEMELHRVDCLSSHGSIENLDFIAVKQEEFANEPLIPPPLVSGKDLIELGLKPSPVFKILLEEAQTHQLEGTLKEREEALRWLKERVVSGLTEAGEEMAAQE